MPEKIIKSIPELQDFATRFIKAITPNEKGATLVCLKGNLGSGKTAFVKAVAKVLGIKENVPSPTFILMKSYKLPVGSYKFLIHIDAYRLHKGEELKKLGWDSLMSDPANLILLEWPEQVADIIPSDAITLNFEFIDEQTRKVTFDT